MSLMYFWCFYWNFRTYFIFVLMVLLLTQNRLIINRQETKNKSLKHYKPRSIPPMKSKFYRNFNIFQFLTVFELTWIRRWGNICCQTLVTHLHGNFFSLMYIVFLFFWCETGLQNDVKNCKILKSAIPSEVARIWQEIENQN